MPKDSIQQLLESIARVGKHNSTVPMLSEVGPLRNFLLPDGSIDYARLDERNGACTHREIFLRFLVLNAVLDQGPDMAGVRQLLTSVTNKMYLAEVRFLHKPLAFFAELGIAIDQILADHKSIKKARAAIWAAENQSNPTRYNLFMDNSTQALNYAIFRWGVPIALPLLLEKDNKIEEHKPTVLTDYLESWDSAEEMSQQLKDNERYGLGKAIGDKACHLLAKWMVSSFGLSRRKESSWREFAFEVPYDLNAGRVLWRTGYFLKWASEKDYIRAEVVQPKAGKGGTHYIRVTNIRGMGAIKQLPAHLQPVYTDVVMNHLKTNKRPPRKVEIQRIQHAYLLSNFADTGFSVADFDEGLMNIGTQYCLNISEPKCKSCPINRLCEGHQSNERLITDFRT